MNASKKSLIIVIALAFVAVFLYGNGCKKSESPAMPETGEEAVSAAPSV